MLVIAACDSTPNPPTTIAAQALEQCALPQDSVRYHLVVDRSGSMAPFWNQVRQQLAATIDSVPERGVLHVETFSNQVLTPVRDRQVTGATRAEIRQQALLFPEPVPGEKTDIGRALQTAAGTIEDARQAGRGRVTFLFVVTDGKHDPPAGSAFSGESAFNVLRQRWAELPSRTRTDLIVLAVPIGKDGLAGAQRVASVIPNTVVLPPQTIDQIGRTLAAEVRRAGQDLLRARVAPEVAQPRLVGRLVESPQTVGFWGTTEVPVMLHSQASCVTYQVATGSDTAWAAIAPGDSFATSLEVQSPRSSAEAWPWQAVRAGSGLPLHAQVAFAPRNELVRMAVDPAAKTAEVPVAGVVRYPPMGWLTFGALLIPVLLLILGIFVLIKWKAHRAYLTGRAQVERKPEGSSVPQVIDFRASKKQSYTFHDPENAAIVTLEARSSRGHTTVYAKRGTVPVTVISPGEKSQALAVDKAIRKPTRFESELGVVSYSP